MNFNKVKAFINAKKEEYKPHYPEAIFEGFSFEVYSGSFGRCFITLKNNYYSYSDRYCANYGQIEATFSDFVVRSYESMCAHFYHEHKKEQKAHPMSATLTIYQDKKQVNVFNFDTLEKAQKELIKIFVAKEKRGVKTRITFKPYSDDLTIVQYFPKESNGTAFNYRYVYEFKGVNY